jgi:hypothetical protein
MSEAQQLEVNSPAHQRNAARISRDEQELQELMKQAGMAKEDEAPEEEQQTTEAEPRSEEPVAEPVQAESSTKQEEADKAEASQEADDAELSAEEKNFKKRYGDLRRHVQEKEQEWKVKFEKLQSQLDKATKNELVLPKTTEEIEAWANKYPDVAGIVEAIADRKAEERASDIDKRLKEIEELREDAKRQRAEAELLQLHPDFEDIRNDDAFHTWAEAQPKVYQDALYENAEDVQSVSRVIDMYKLDKGISTTKKNNSSSADKAAASSVRTKRNTQPEQDETSSYLSESQVAKMPIKEYERRQEEIMEAQRSGKFIYDVTKR